ncbi:MAG: hypothetical protein RL385_5572 [Pseudomonadota bacterium]|jgi:hypothetical protein
MRIGIIGGAECVETQYQRTAESAGHSVEFHSGNMSSRGTASLERLVRRCDLVVIVTEVNSHAAVLKARGLARTHKRPVHFCRRFGVHGLTALIDGPLKVAS